MTTFSVFSDLSSTLNDRTDSSSLIPWHKAEIIYYAYLLLLENGYRTPGARKKTAYLIEKGMPAERLCEVMKEAQEARARGEQILVARMNKNKKFQKEQLTQEGYEEFKEFYCNPLL